MRPSGLTARSDVGTDGQTKTAFPRERVCLGAAYGAGCHKSGAQSRVDMAWRTSPCRPPMHVHDSHTCSRLLSSFLVYEDARSRRYLPEPWQHEHGTPPRPGPPGPTTREPAGRRRSHTCPRAPPALILLDRARRYLLSTTRGSLRNAVNFDGKGLHCIGRRVPSISRVRLW